MLNEVFNHAHHVSARVLFRKPLAIAHAEDLHALVILEVRKQLRRDKEVLPALCAARHFDKGVMHSAFVARVHTLVDLVDEREGRSRELR